MDVDYELLLLLKRSEERLVDSLLKSSDEYLLDILHTAPYPSHLTLALLAEAVYIEKEPLETDQAYGERLLLPEGWRLLTTASNSDFLNKYFGAAFFHAGSQQVVVAHRGTIPTKVGPLYTDVVGIFFNKYTSCMNSSVTFVDFVSQVIHNVNSKSEKVKRRYNLTITGHSLGGWLAQVTTFTARYVKVSDGALIKNTSDGVHAKAVVFDSPGAKDMLNQIQDKHYSRYGKEFLDRINMLDVTVYVSAPNRINTCGAHFRIVYRVFIDLSKFKFEDMETGLYNEKTHAIGNFVEAFKENSPNVTEVLDWAKDIDEYKSLFEDQMLNQANDFHVDSKKNKKIEYFEEIKKRYQVAPSEPEIILKNLNVFSDAEVKMLDYLVIIQKQTDITILNEFLLKEKLVLKSGKLFADFEINHKTRTISCKSKQLLEEVSARVKQLMRWKGPEFSKAVEEQSRTTDLIYRREGQTYFDSIPKSRLNFTDSIGLRNFLLSPNEQTFCVVTQDSSFEMTRLHNIVFSMSDSPNQYTSEGHYTFLDWPRLKSLFEIYGSPVDQNDLMVIDASLTPTISSELPTFLNNYAQSSSPILKKLVFILSHPIDTIIVKTFNSNRKINLMDLSTESQETICKSKMIFFKEIVGLSFREIMGENCSLSEFNEVISSNCLKSIVTEENHVIRIKDTRPRSSDLQMALIKTDIKVTSKECVLNCVDLPNSMVVMSGLNRGDLETGTGWEQLQGNEILLAEGDAEQFFKKTCDQYQYKTIYLLEVSGDAKADVRCKQIFNGAFYVSRKFRHRASINLQKFAESKHANDLFVAYSEEHKTLLLEMTKDCKEREAFKENVLIANSEEQEVDIIHKYSHKNIHFMKVVETDEQNESVDVLESYKFYSDVNDVSYDSDVNDDSNDGDERVVKYPSEIEWRFSHGSAKSLRPCMSTKFLKPIDELSLSKTERNLVVITDEPGMGKTTSLARLSRLLEAPWIIYMEFKLFKNHIDNLSELTPQNVATFLLSASGSNSDSALNLAHGLLLYFLNSKACSKRVVLMFDGFDEIDDYIKNKDSSKDKIVKLLTFLQSKPTIQVFLTARKYLKESLETNLSQLSTSFVTLNAQEQLDFLFKFWRSSLPLELGEYGEEEEGRLKKYAGEVLRQARVVLGPDMNRFMGVPLQLRMLAEVFRPQSHLLRQSPELLLKQINIVSAPNLYKLYVDLKYQIYLQEKTSKCEVYSEDEINLFLIEVTETHGKVAFRLFFPHFYSQNLDPIKNELLNTLNRVGLVQTKGDSGFEFVHRTYAEYCCAQMVVHWLNQRTLHCRYELFQEIIIPQILLHPDSKIIRMFMNVLINETTMSEKVLELNSKCISQLWNEESSIFRNERHQTVLHIAVRENNEHIATLLLSVFSAEEAFVSLIQQYDLNNNTAINYLNKPKLHNVNKNELELDKITIKFLKHIATCSDENKANIFLTILFNRKVSESSETAEKFFFERFFNRHGIKASKESTEEENIIIINLFYRVINKFISCTERIFDRVKEFELVIEPFKKAVNKKKVKLVKTIIFKKLENNVERYCFLLMRHKDQLMRTVLHIAIAAGYLDIVRILVKQTAVPFTVLMAQRDRWLDTPLHTAVSGRGGLDITKYLVERGADINTRGLVGMSVLMHAAERGELPTVKYLVEIGADIHATDRSGQTVLHYAVLGKDPRVVEYFLQQGVDPDRVDRWGKTALTVASRHERLDVVRLLLKRGVDINADGGRALSEALRYGRWSIVEALINKGAAIKESQIEYNLSEFKVKYPNYEFKK